MILVILKIRLINGLSGGLRCVVYLSVRFLSFRIRILKWIRNMQRNKQPRFTKVASGQSKSGQHGSRLYLRGYSILLGGSVNDYIIQVSTIFSLYNLPIFKSYAKDIWIKRVVRVFLGERNRLYCTRISLS